MLQANHRVAILLHEGIRGTQGKTGLALLRYSEAPIVAVVDRDCAGASLSELTGIPCTVPIVASVAETLPYQPDVLAIGIAPSGGILPDAWKQEIQQAVAAGMSIANGLHTPLAHDPDLRPLLHPHQWIWDVRQEPSGLTVGSGAARLLPCRRVLAVGTDMGVGKMATSLELHRASRQQGLHTKFLGTGQAGLMIAGDGIPLDAIRVDFAAGAVEQMVLRFGQDYDILYIEGQGSLFNPASTATLPLMRGSQPTHLVLVHRAGQTHIRTFSHVKIPPLPDVIQVYEAIATAGGAFAPAKVVAIALNTAHLDPDKAQQAIAQTQLETGLPCTDPVRSGVAPILAQILAKT
ncbi:MAG: DUF1611 domain-containing protein [Scytolyngbya sp. HA4215-MV1]|nr:DUF1611 domain-containing protein [Scytolyngbya sp. HA4215-MV1]